MNQTLNTCGYKHYVCEYMTDWVDDGIKIRNDQVNIINLLGATWFIQYIKGLY